MGTGIFLSLGFSEKSPPSGWTGYKVFFIPDNTDLTKLKSLLGEKTYSGTMSPWNSQVEISDFTGLESVAVADLEFRMADSDPRWTGYLRNILSFFKAHHRGEAGWTLFLPESLDINFQRDYVNIFGIPPASLGEGAGLPGLLALFGKLVLYGVWLVAWYFFLGKKWNWIPIPGTLGFLLILFSPGLIFLAFGFQTLLFLGHRWIREIHHSPTRRDDKKLTAGFLYTLVILLGLVTLGLLRPFDSLYWIAFFLGVPTLGALGKWYWNFENKEKILREHKLFSPLSLALNKDPWRVMAKIPTISLVIIPLITLGLMPSLDLPSLNFFPGSTTIPLAFSPQMEEQSQEEESSGIPGGASWLRHRIFQEGFIYNLTKINLSQPTSKIRFPFYERSGEKIRETDRNTLVFDQEYLNSLSSKIKKNHPVNLVLENDRLKPLTLGNVGFSNPGSGNLLPQLVTLGLLYFFLVLIRLGPILFTWNQRLPSRARRDSVA